ncbi:hypothetical protein RKE25_10855 [Dyella sp. BiH032]|uniref:hypothetical protein n=1 Tax=Dyella sp. BiH032 TaxID=3075430 RepID=UPI0028936998|nr:hypothetical protein [Dyella sp. BiH032]WNL48090.1 hypothetical protein RKE25_10855 [Dyella sp. BiH032]
MEQEWEGRPLGESHVERIIERESWNGFTIEVEYDYRYIYGPQYKATWIWIDQPGKSYLEKKTTIEPLLEKGFDIRSALQYVLQNVKATLEVLTSG